VCVCGEGIETKEENKSRSKRNEWR